MPVKRMVFHEITPQAIREAIENPRDIDRRLVDAQEARRLLDRIYGYGPLADVARQKVGPGHHRGAGAERGHPPGGRARARAHARSSAPPTGTSRASSPPGPPRGRRRAPFAATLVQLDGRRLATGKDFGEDGVVRGDVAVLDEARATALAAGAARRRRSRCAAWSASPTAAARPPPFITSTFQQEAGRKLRLSSSMAMRSAQSLYEAGYITYMRTDSTTLSDTALTAARSEIAERYGRQFLPDAPRLYAKKVKNAQEAHEAIRPAGDTFRSPEHVAREVNAERRQGLRADLEAHDRLADDRRHRRDGHGPPRRGRPRRRARATSSSPPAARSSPTRASAWPTWSTATRATTPTSRSASCPP